MTLLRSAPVTPSDRHRVITTRDTNHVVGMELGLRMAVRDRRTRRDTQDVDAWLRTLTAMSRSHLETDGVIFGYMVGYQIGLSAWDGHDSPLDVLRQYLATHDLPASELMGAA